MNKHQRQFTIKEIITNQVIGSQEELARALKKAGLEVNQATLSRDLREMGIARVSLGEGFRYGFLAGSEDVRLKALMSYEVKSIAHNETMVVIKTLAGRAQGVAELIDGMGHPDILATLAGDNTIFIAPKSAKSVNKLVQELKNFISA
jgi:transcriptional regulator of arginine metabolism